VARRRQRRRDRFDVGEELGDRHGATVAPGEWPRRIGDA
jgi:hypothetical protein